MSYLHVLSWERLVPDPAQYQIKGTLRSWLARARILANQWQPQIFDPIIDWLQERSAEVACQRLSVVHGDFYPDNIVVRDDGRMFVIDWTGIDVLDYRFDLAWTLMLLCTTGAAEMGNAMIKEYERLVGYRVENMEFFEVLACCRRLFDISVSLSSGAMVLGMKPEAEVQMRKKSNHIRLVYEQLQTKTGCTLPEIEKLIFSLP